MTERSPQAFSADYKRIAAAAVFTLGFAAAAAAFAVGYTSALTAGLADPASAPLTRLAALEQLDKSLGHGGFLKAYAAFLATGDRTPETEFRHLVDEADASLAAFSRASTSEQDIASAQLLRRLEAPFRRAASIAAGTARTSGGPIPAAQLERDYGALASAIAAAADSANRGRLDILAGALARAEMFFLGTLLLVSMGLIVLAFQLRRRRIAALANPCQGKLGGSAGRGLQAPRRHERREQIEWVARAAGRLAADTGPKGDPALPPLHMKIMEQLAEGAARLESDMAKSAAAIEAACLRIEQAGTRAAEAGQAAIDALLGPDGVNRVAGSARDRMDAAALRLSRTASELPPQTGNAAPSLPDLQDEEAAAVLESLAGGLDALERYARERRSIEAERLVALSWALFRAVDRLNAVAYALSGPDDPDARHAAE